MLNVQKKLANTLLNELELFEEVVANAATEKKPNEDVSDEYIEQWNERIIRNTNLNIEKLRKAISDDSWNEVKDISGNYLSIGKKLDSFGCGWTKLESEIDNRSDFLFKSAKDIEMSN